ncbi:MAG: hypothetical protein AAF327_17345, partial [Cyanobacteria bacterium P01_A01_bin.37]
RSIHFYAALELANVWNIRSTNPELLASMGVMFPTHFCWRIFQKIAKTKPRSPSPPRQRSRLNMLFINSINDDTSWNRHYQRQ